MSHVTRISFWQLDYTKFQVWLITVMSNNPTKTFTIKLLMYLVTYNTNLHFRGKYFININMVSNFNTNILTLLTLTVSFKAVILSGLCLDLRRQGNKCETTQTDLIALFLQSGCRQAVSHMFWYKGKPVYTRPSQKPYFSREFLEAAAEILQEDEHAPATKSAFNSKVKTFFTFTSEIGLTDLPPDGHEMVIYATWLTLSSHCSTAGSLRQYLSAVKVLCRQKALFCPSPTEYGPLLAMVSGMAARFAAPV
jgi:hypothetical protein